MLKIHNKKRKLIPNEYDSNKHRKTNRKNAEVPIFSIFHIIPKELTKLIIEYLPAKDYLNTMTSFECNLNFNPIFSEIFNSKNDFFLARNIHSMGVFKANKPLTIKQYINFTRDINLDDTTHSFCTSVKPALMHKNNRLKYTKLCCSKGKNVSEVYTLLQKAGAVLLGNNDPHNLNLIDAVNKKDYELIKISLKNGADPNILTNHKTTLLDHLFFSRAEVPLSQNFILIVELLVQAGIKLNHNRMDTDSYLCLALLNFDNVEFLKISKILLNGGYDIFLNDYTNNNIFEEIYNSFDDSYLLNTTAVTAEQLEDLEDEAEILYIEHTEELLIPFFNLCMKSYLDKRSEIFYFNFELALINENMIFINYIIKNFNLMSESAELNSDNNLMTNSNKQTILHLAALHNNLDVFLLILKNSSPAFTNIKDNTGQSALLIAAKNGLFNVDEESTILLVSSLFSAGADFNTVDNFGNGLANIYLKYFDTMISTYSGCKALQK